MRSTYPLNHGWLFAADNLADSVPDNAFHPATLPHSNVILPHHNFDDAEYQFISTYRKRFTLPEPLNGRRLFIDFEGAMIAATVTINGQTFEEHRGGYTPFSFDITDYIKQDGENLLIVHLDSTERKDIPPFGFVVDYLTFGGIYREAQLRYVEPVYIKNVFVKTFDVLTDNPRVEVDVTVENTSESDFSDHIALLLQLEDGATLSFGLAEHIDVPAGETLTQSILIQGDELLNRDESWTDDSRDGEAFTEVLPLELWSPDNPYLYRLTVVLAPLESEEAIDAGEEPLDDWGLTFGFRDAVFKEDGFYLNGELLQLRGLNRHQTYPYIGAAAPAKLQQTDADIVKYDLGCNIVRTSHYPQSKAFIERCDEIGLLVFEEIPGWQHIGDEDWQTLVLRDVRVMIERDWNHPSIILWGVRVNESPDNDALYTKTNALAHELDPTRQTGGVRYIKNSNKLEDVFTYNDFSNGIIEPHENPWLVTEFNGHMFPTKTFDGEERRLEHALRHARVQSQAVMMGGVSGAIGWCAFDYNTHKEFGSGDRICYHGVMDMFRQPKWAAHFYGSQISPEVRPVLQAATGWTMGDRSVGGNDPLTVFTNCDEIEVFLGEESQGRFQPDEASYPGLPHPPVTVKGVQNRWGQAFAGLKIIGYHEGKAIIEQQMESDSIPRALHLRTAHEELIADGRDMTWLWFSITDAYDNPLPYGITVVNFTIKGPGELIGENPFPLVGGQGGLFIKSSTEPGTITVQAHAPHIAPVSISVTTKR